jgi:hypothetical protein
MPMPSASEAATPAWSDYLLLAEHLLNTVPLVMMALVAAGTWNCSK